MSLVIANVKTENAKRWSEAKATRDFVPAANRLIVPSAKTRYQAVESRTRVPWYIIAVIHERESGQSWTANLAQGDPWNKKSVHVPIGRGPFDSWEDAAVDALVNCAPYAAANTDWSIGGLLTLLERYNGLGYAMRGLPSPYIWSGTDQYESGKFTADGFFNPHAIDQQLGCAGLLMAMAALDSNVAAGVGQEAPPPVPIAMVDPPPPGPIARFWNAVFRWGVG